MLLNIILFITLLLRAAAFNRESIDECTRVLSENLQDTFKRVTGEQKIAQFYEKFVESEQFDPRVELKRSKDVIEKYLKRRSEFAYKAKVSLEARDPKDSSDEAVNNPDSKDFIRFMSAKQGNDGTTIYEHSHIILKKKVMETRNFTLLPNANFYSLPTSPIASAVHIPTPLYDRNPTLLRKIEWSEIDPVYRTHREEVRDLAFQLFCSESGYMRFYPAASWFWDNHIEHLDLFDCRNTEWYINAATNSKNVLIMLDLSGSMLGQRYEIAKQTTEAILETLSHNDYFNIMPFSKTPFFLDDCNGENGLLQATMRNKKALRNKMNNVSSEGKAEYERALPHAFTTLLNLPKRWTIYSKEEFAVLLQNSSVMEGKQITELPEHFLVYDHEYDRAITSAGRKAPAQGCENVIMLITDGAPNAYKEIFDLYNNDKKVRFFSFLIGEEAIDFEQVKQMACYNRGYMVHVQNMADVEEKVQHYIRTMSRPIGKHAADIGADGAMWSGVYRERLYIPRPETFAEPVPITNQSFAVMNKMAARRKIRLQKTEARSRMFVTTVSYPVIVNETFMGVAAVNIPLTELNQLAHPSNVGSRSYFFMLDQNGFIILHPQLRAIDPITKLHKQNYNNMDVLELEVQQSQQIRMAQSMIGDASANFNCEHGSYSECVAEIRNLTRKMIFDCDNSEEQQLDVLFATENLLRVYPQTNNYYSECINGANFIIGLAVADNDDYRIRRRERHYDYSRVKQDWISSKQFRVHPHWRYCLLNDTDTHMSKEEAFYVYVQQMVNTGKLPELCKARQTLVEKVLIDLEATSALQDNWDQNWQYLKDNLIHLVFFTAPSGMIRYYNLTLDDYDYSDPNWSILDHIGRIFAIELVQESYNHFITDLHRKSVDDYYYKRSVRMPDDIIFDVSNNSKIWYKSETQLTGYGNNENLTMLAQATKAVRSGNAVLGVTGYEFAYDNVVNLMGEHGCGPSNDRKWCLLLDEHGYVFYSNQKDISYEDYLRDPIGYGKHISHWFGNINRVSQRAMALLVERKFYTKFKYTDHQAICKDHPKVVMSSKALKPLHSLLYGIMAFINNFLLFVQKITFVPLLSSTFTPGEAYTASFHDGSDGYPCSKSSYFYLFNKNPRTRPKSSSLVENGRYDKPCPTTKCSVKMHASFVEGTNLLMVWINQEDKSDLCYDEVACPKLENTDTTMNWEQDRSEKNLEDICVGELHSRPKRSRAMCFGTDGDVSQEGTRQPCSSKFALSWLISTIISWIFYLAVC
ncbi:unnamed protein product [Auanema sp. JU1783]|nr:unnamed protein product [Auanema sp. JU1783]